MIVAKIILAIALSALMFAAATFLCVACVWFIRDLRGDK